MCVFVGGIELEPFQKLEGVSFGVGSNRLKLHPEFVGIFCLEGTSDTSDSWCWDRCHAESMSQFIWGFTFSRYNHVAMNLEHEWHVGQMLIILSNSLSTVNCWFTITFLEDVPLVVIRAPGMTSLNVSINVFDYYIEKNRHSCNQLVWRYQDARNLLRKSVRFSVRQRCVR